MKRPDILSIQNGEELKRWYWLKQELVEYCKLVDLGYAGSKFDLLDRIANALDNKEHKEPKSKTSKQKVSKFNWHSEVLTPDTIITDSYRNSQNVRRFFVQQCGSTFRFSIALMDFMKNNCGNTLQDAVSEWQRLNEQGKDKNFKSEIPPGNQYNKYIRDFFADNPNMTMAEARHFWKLKRSLPLGRHIYEKEDLELQ
jgi:hypothetical protein